VPEAVGQDMVALGEDLPAVPGHVAIDAQLTRRHRQGAVAEERKPFTVTVEGGLRLPADRRLAFEDRSPVAVLARQDLVTLLMAQLDEVTRALREPHGATTNADLAGRIGEVALGDGDLVDAGVG